MVSPLPQRGGDHIEESNSTASLFLGSVRRTWMSRPKSTPGLRESRPAMRPVANPSTSDRPAHAPGPALMSPVTPGANVDPASLNSSADSSSVNVQNKPDTPTAAFPSPVSSATSRPSPKTTYLPANGMAGTTEAVQPQPPNPRASRPEDRDTGALAEVSTGQETNQVAMPSLLPARTSIGSPHVPSRHGTNPTPVQSPRPATTAQAIPAALSQSTRLGQTPSHLNRLTPSPGAQENHTPPPRAVSLGQTTSRVGAEEHRTASPRTVRLDQTPLHSNQPTSNPSTQENHTARQPVRLDDTRSHNAVQQSNAASPRPLRLETNCIPTRAFPQPSDETWRLWHQKLDELKELAARSSSPIFEPRLQLLNDACAYRDVVYLLLHQLYCRLYIEPIIPDHIAWLRSDACANGFEQVRHLLEDNCHLPRDAIVAFSQFPARLEELMIEPWFSTTFRDLARFLTLLAQRFMSDCNPVFAHVPARRYPPLVDELGREFEVKTPVFMSVIFASLCRRLYDNSHLPRLNEIFRADLASGPQAHTKVIELYRKIPMKGSTPTGPGQEPPPPQPSTTPPRSQPQSVSQAGQPIAPSNDRFPPPTHVQQSTTSSTAGPTRAFHPSQHVTIPMHPPLPTSMRGLSQVTNQNEGGLQQHPHPQPGATSQNIQSNSPHNAHNMSPMTPARHMPYQYPSQQIPHAQSRPPMQLPGQLWQMNQQGQLVPFDASQMLSAMSPNQWQAQSGYPTSTSAAWRGPVSQVPRVQGQQASPRGEQPSQAQVPQVPHTQMQSMQLAPQAQVPPHPSYARSQLTPHRPSWPSLASEQAHQTQIPQGSSPIGSSSMPPNRGSRPSQISRETSLASSSPHTNSSSMPAPQLPWPSQVTQQNRPQPLQSPAALSSQRRFNLEATSQEPSSPARIHQAPNLQSGLPISLLPPSGYRIPHTVQPNPMRLGLHQADLRDPIKKLLHQTNSGELLKTELFQYLGGFVLSPKFINPETFIYNWNFSLSHEDYARCPRTIDLGEGSASIREYQKGCRIFRLRSIAVRNFEKRPVANLWPTSNTIWPSVFYVHVNDVELQVRRKAHNGKDLPLDLTNYLHEGQNKISIHLLLDSKECKDFSYVFGIESIFIGSFQNLRGRVGSISAADVRTQIQKRLNPSTAEDDDLTVVTDSLTISLIDPFMAQIFLEPARSVHCKHLECFDLATFIKTRRSVSGPGPMNDNWRCPICNADARPQCLIVDQFLVQVRSELEGRNQLDGAQAIEIKANGQWSVKIISDEAHPNTENQQPRSSNAGKRKADDAPDSASTRPRTKIERPASGTPVLPNDPIVVELD